MTFSPAVNDLLLKLAWGAEVSQAGPVGILWHFHWLNTSPAKLSGTVGWARATKVYPTYNYALAVFHFYTTTVPKTTIDEKRLDWWMGSLTYVALRLSECLNPVFYNLASG